MAQPDYDELEKVKFHVLSRIPRDERGAFWWIGIGASIAICLVLGGIGYLANKLGHDALMAIIIIGTGFGSGFALSILAMVSIRIEAIQRHLLTLHEDLLSVHSDVREQQIR